MADIVFMGVDKSLQDLSKNISSLLFCVVALVSDVVKKLTAFAHFLNKVYIFFILIDFKESNHIRMIESL